MDTAPLNPPQEPSGVTQADTTAHDDRVRWYLARMIVIQFVIVAGGICAYMIFRDSSEKPITNGVLSVLIMVIQAEISYVTVSLTYYFGSSSGSTAKSVAQEKKNA